MTYGILVKVSDPSEKKDVVKQTPGLHVYPEVITTRDGIFIAYLFAGSFRSVPNPFINLTYPIYVYTGDVYAGGLDETKIRPVLRFVFPNLRYTNKEDAPTMPIPATCSVCGEEVLNGDYGNYESICHKCLEGWLNCQNCHVRQHPDKIKQIEDYNICVDCWDTVVGRCSVCGSEYLKGNLRNVDGVTICDRCFRDSSITARCFRCETTHIRDRMHTDGHITLCDGCRRRYAVCECGRFLDGEGTLPRDVIDGSVWCGDCKRSRKFYGDYRYRPPVLNFFSMSEEDTSPYMGWEIEMTRGNRMDTLQAWKDIDEVWCKRDGSIDGSTGIELVSHPCSFNYLMSVFPWDKVLKICIRNGYVSHKDEACGFHVHLDREAFGNSSSEQDVNILRVAWILTKFWTQFARFSRRSSASLERWAQQYKNLIDGDTPNNKHVERMKGSGCTNKYMCLNLVHRTTVELRFFRGTLNLETILASLQLCKVFIDLKELSLLELYELSWSEFFDRCRQYKELMSYMERRGITDESCSASPVESECETEEQVEITVTSLNELLGRGRFTSHEGFESDEPPQITRYIRRRS